MSSNKNVVLHTDDASFISIVQNFIEPVFIGDYKPGYLESTDMKSLVWSDISPLAQEDSPIIFSKSDNRISAIFLDLSEVEGELFDSIKNNINSLLDLKELFVILPEDKQFFQISSLVKLQLLEIHRREEPISLPENFDIYKDLSVLVIQGKVEKINQSIKELKSLQRLVIRDTILSDFPLEICNLKKLVWLEFGNCFTVLPDEITQLKSLIVLDLISEEINELPQNIGELKNLVHVSLEMRNITTLPSSFSKLSKITDLYFWNLQVETIPDVILLLTNLQYLWFKENSRLKGTLIELPPNIDKLINLVELQVNGHEIENIPKSIGKLKNLKILNISINNYTSIPQEIGNLKELERLELYYTNLKELPDSLTNLSKLDYLDISDTKLTKLPEEFGKLSKLTSIDTAGTPLEDFPKSMAKIDFKQIRSFYISLTKKLEEIDPLVLSWINNLVEYSDKNPDLEIDIEISDYKEEFDDE